MVPIFSPNGFGRFLDSHSRRTSSSTSHKPAPSPSLSRPSTEPMATVLIGPKQQRFKVNKQLLCATSPFFAERFDDPSNSSRSISLWLPRESASMFGLFVDWVHLGLGFRQHLDEAVSNAYDAGDEATRNIHWSMIRLHLFASRLGLYRLQDLSMDAIQDLYLRCDWDVPPGLVTFLYTECEDLAAIRLRRWAVAMVAFSFTGGPRLTFHPQDSTASEPARFSDLLEELPEFAADYDMHMNKMRLSGLDIRFKNPQLRIPANRLRNEERAFGFRQCSFHSHRASVGERRCPHDAGSSKHRRVHPPGAAVPEQKGSESTGLTAPTRRYHDVVPKPLFSGPADEELGEEDDEIAKAIKHVRSISSTLKT
ncbi:hypothetical protein LCI18_010535 [Fusarium solani-melongenae]|uniref:Uncharacterized protein n=1 Tax=Fusarium solani subsp. cucurbitae TaxID=2747967 RepID=A0ACD3ZEE8_FUSSC|nr:hypothetical protein LCI18_010535 [Fusarium solani-melongenae]